MFAENQNLQFYDCNNEFDYMQLENDYPIYNDYYVIEPPVMTKKRHGTFGDDNGDKAPSRKRRRINADKMAFGLRNFHISDHVTNINRDQNWFFMNKPNETFAQIEARLSSSSDDDAEIDQSASTSEPLIEVSPEVRRLLDQQKREQHTPSPWLLQPSTDMSVVLWQPRDEILLNGATPNSVPESSSSTSSAQPQNETSNPSFNLNNSMELEIDTQRQNSDSQCKSSLSPQDNGYFVSFPADYESDSEHSLIPQAHLYENNNNNYLVDPNRRKRVHLNSGASIGSNSSNHLTITEMVSPTGDGHNYLDDIEMG